MNSKQTEGRNQTDANVYIDRAIAMLKDLPEIRESETVAGYNGVVSLLQYAKESHTASLPSNPVGDVEEMNVNKIGDVVLTELKKDPNHITKLLNKDEETSYNTGFHTGFKSGYAAAPQKGMRWVKASERLPEKEGLVHYHIENGLHDICFYHKQRGFYKPKMVNPTSERMKLDRDLELIPLPYSLDKIYYLDESPSPSEAGDGWIRVEDELPEKTHKSEYLVFHNPRYDGDDEVTQCGFHSIDAGIWPYATHWQPLPAPPIQKTVK